MKIAINASFLRKQGTGLGQVTANFLQKLIELESIKIKAGKVKKTEFVLYLEEDLELNLPKDAASSAVKFRKKVFLPPYKRDDLLRKIWWEKFLLPKKVAQDKCDVLLSLYQSTTVVSSKKIKHLMVVHDLIPKLFPTYLSNWRKKLYQNLVEKAIRKTDRIIAISHRTEKDLIKHLGIAPEKITVSYIDVDERYKTIAGRIDSRRVLQKYNLQAGYIYSGGGLEVRKNVESVLLAYKILLESHKQGRKIPKLVISGKLLPQLAPLVTDVEKLIVELGLQNEVVVLDYVPQVDLPGLYRNALVFVYPSHYEGFGLPILEAMNQGTAVITAKTSSLPEVGSDSVLYCDPSDPADLAMVLKNVLCHPHLQAALSLKGKERAKHFAWEKFVMKVLNVIR
ncbi:MAG: glycosyltransferase family 1 protein [Candidatus Moraniibacteriota bacterium]